MAFQCPICRKPVPSPPDFSSPPPPAGAEKSPFPFCSDRCRTIDLGRWLDEKYQVDVVDPDVEGETFDTEPPVDRA